MDVDVVVERGVGLGLGGGWEKFREGWGGRE